MPNRGPIRALAGASSPKRSPSARNRTALIRAASRPPTTLTSQNRTWCLAMKAMYLWGLVWSASGRPAWGKNHTRPTNSRAVAIPASTPASPPTRRRFSIGIPSSPGSRDRVESGPAADSTLPGGPGA